MKLNLKLALSLCILTSTASTITYTYKKRLGDPPHQKLNLKDQQEQSLDQNVNLLEAILLTTNPELNKKFDEVVKSCLTRRQLLRKLNAIRKSSFIVNPNGLVIINERSEQQIAESNKTHKKLVKADRSCKDQIKELRQMLQPITTK